MSIVYEQKNRNLVHTKRKCASSILDSSSQNKSLQRKADMVNNATQQAEASRPNNTGMPDNLKSGFESLSGFSMDDVRVHYNSSKPATIQALAYTQGTDIHVAPGQEKCLPHEAWHVAQQMAGRVSPTTSINGMPVNDNATLEHEADVMGVKAIQMLGERKCESKKCCNAVVRQSKFIHGIIKNNKVNLNSGVLQCANVPKNFTTKNDEGRKPSRYYISKEGYERIAPINSLRAPNQEYHVGNRNFVYYQASGFDISYVLEDIFKGCVKFNCDGMPYCFYLSLFGWFENLVDEIASDSDSTEKLKSFDYKAFLNEVVSDCGNDFEFFEDSYREKAGEKIKNCISIVPKFGLTPFDWNGKSKHFGHPIASVEEGSSALSDSERDFYKSRKERAASFAEESFGGSKSLMDACFGCLWESSKKIIPLFESMDREEYYKKVDEIFLKSKKFKDDESLVWHDCYSIFESCAKKESKFYFKDEKYYSSILNYISNNSKQIKEFCELQSQEYLQE